MNFSLKVQTSFQINLVETFAGQNRMAYYPSSLLQITVHAILLTQDIHRHLIRPCKMSLILQTLLVQTELSECTDYSDIATFYLYF